MSTLTSGPATEARERRRWAVTLDITEMWASVAIAVIWIAVLIDAAFGPDIVSNGGANNVGGSTTVPSVVVVAFFAFLATGAIAKYGFRRDDRPRG